MNDERTPWSLADLRNVRPDLPAEPMEALLKVCNKAIELGLTRSEVEDSVNSLAGRDFPDGAAVFAALRSALEERFAQK